MLRLVCQVGGATLGQGTRQGREGEGRELAADRGDADASGNILASALVAAATWQSLILLCPTSSCLLLFLHLLLRPRPPPPFLHSPAHTDRSQRKPKTENFTRPTHIAAISVFCPASPSLPCPLFPVLVSVCIFIAPT